MKVLVIPDVHLKPFIFDRADRILQSGQADFAVQIGDLVDDWGQITNVGKYNQTMKRAYDFHKAHPDTLWVMGNHDYDYVHPFADARSSGHSRLAEVDMSEWLAEMDDIGARPQFVHIVNNVIFTHAGLTKSWMARLLGLYNNYEAPENDEHLRLLVNFAVPADFFMESSPIWARPQFKVDHQLYDYHNHLQVVGHTPVEGVNLEDNFLSTDTFSTYRDGTPFGDQTFAIVDTATKKWHLAEEE